MTTETRATKILIVEDESIIAFDIERCLKNNGYDVVGNAASHKETMDKVNSTKPDLVLMDIRIHGEFDGIDCAKQIRYIFETPVVFLTAHSDKNTIERATKTKAFGYVLKPFNERTLIANIEMALSNYGEELKILRTRENLSITLNRLNLGVIIFDRDGLITFMNMAIRALTGWDKSMVLGKPLKSLLFDKINDQEIEFESVIKEGIDLCLIDVIAHNSETPNSVSFDLTISPIVQGGEIDGGMMVFHNYGTVVNSYIGQIEKSENQVEGEKFIPVLVICPWCKKWKDEQSNWNQIEEFINKKTSAQLSHHACPECVKILIRNIQLKLEKHPGHRKN